MFRIISFFFVKKSTARTLFTIETLNLTEYQKNRQDALDNVIEANKFKWELQVYVENESEMDANRLKAALEVLAHLAQPEFEDVNLIKNTLYALNSVKGVTDKAKRSVGNLIMKTCYSINITDAAIEVSYIINLSN